MSLHSRSAGIGAEVVGGRHAERREAVSAGSRCALRAACVLTMLVSLVAPARAGDGAETLTEKARLSLDAVPAAQPGASSGAGMIEDQPALVQSLETALVDIEERRLEQARVRLNVALEQATVPYYELLYAMARLKVASGHLGEARVAAEQALAARPEAVDAHYLLGRLHMGGERWEAALHHFRAATQAGPEAINNPRVTASWFLLGKCLEQTEYLTAAEEAFARFDEALFESHPEHRYDPVVEALAEDLPHGALYLRVALLDRLGEPARAAAVIKAALERSPDDASLKRMYARSLLDAGKAEAALSFCEAQLDLGADLALEAVEGQRGLLSLALEAARAAGRLESWTARVGEMVRDGRGQALGMTMAGALEDAEAYGAASKLWEALLAQSPGTADYAWALARARLLAGDAEGALRALGAFAGTHPEVQTVSWERYSQWLEAWAERAEWGETVRPFVSDSSEAIAPWARQSVGATAALGAGETTQAVTWLQAALDAAPENGLARWLLGDAHCRAYDWDAALAATEPLLKGEDVPAPAWFVRGKALAGLDQADRAEEAFEAAVKAAPDDAAYALRLGRHYRRSGTLIAAQRYFQQALSKDPRNPDALEELIEAYLGGGKLEIAQMQLAEAEALDLPEDALRRARTSIQFAKQPFQEAHLSALREQFAAHPEDAATGLKLAAGLYLRHTPEDALRVIERVLALEPENYRALLVAARVRMQLLEYAAAEEMLDTLAQRYPNRTEVLTLLGMVRLYQHERAAAQEVFRKILDVENLDTTTRRETRRHLLESYVEFSEYEPALELIDTWLEQEPEDRLLWLEKIIVLMAADREDEAIEMARRRLQEAPEDARLDRRAEFLQICMEAEKLDLAEEQVRGWLTANPDDPQYKQWLVQVLLAKEQPEEALDILAGITADTLLLDAALRRWRARCHAVAGRIDVAVEALEGLLEEPIFKARAAERSDLRLQLLQTLLRDDRYDDALERVDTWLAEIDPREPFERAALLEMRMVVLQAAGQTDEYVQTGMRLLDMDTGDAGVNNDLGYSLVDAGRNVTRAHDMIRFALSQQPMNAAFLDSMGWAEYKLGRYEEAVKYLERSVRLRTGKDPIVYDHLGDALYRLGREADARAAWEEALGFFEEQEADEDAPTEVERVREQLPEKLEALDEGRQPPVAPTADEQNATQGSRA